MIPLRDTIKARKTPIITVGLILANTIVFIYEISLPAEQLEKTIHIWGLVPARFVHTDWARKMGYPPVSFWPFFSSMFLHGGWLHLISNMWALWLFGDNVEDRMGHFRYLVFYLFCGLFAGIVHLAIYAGSTIPTIGASGAIAGVMGSYFLLFPYSRIVVLMPVFIFPLFFEIPAVFYLLIWFLSQFWSGTLALSTQAGQVVGIAFWAHVGGFVTGMTTFRIFVKRR